MTEFEEVLAGTRRWWVQRADNRALLAELADCSIDSVVTDPPYELGFMNKGWDRSGIAFDVGFWAALLRVLKPGGMLAAFSAPRNYHRVACAIEDAGFEIRDQMHDWVYGTGFPHSTDIARQVEMHLCAQPGRHYDKHLPPEKRRRKDDHLCPRDARADPFRGMHTALKPGFEPICWARKPIEGTLAENALKWGTGGYSIDAARIPRAPDDRDPDDLGSWPANLMFTHAYECAGGACAPWCPVGMLDAQSGELKPGGALTGADPSANIRSVYESPGLRGAFTPYGDFGGASKFFYVAKASREERDYGCESLPEKSVEDNIGRNAENHGRHSPSAGAGRNGGGRNNHPTVKPWEVMEHLVRLATPRNGVCLDPFAGSGSTICGAMRAGVRVIGCELDLDYCEIARLRATAVQTLLERPEQRPDATALPGQMGLFGGAK